VGPKHDCSFYFSVRTVVSYGYRQGGWWLLHGRPAAENGKVIGQ
jgi:hypothetical protein